MNIIKANAVTYTLESPERLLIHVCNNKGSMGAGIAKEIKERIPEAFYAYKKGGHLGYVSYGGQVCNMIAQDGYGRDKRYLNYGALSQCLYNVKMDIDYYDANVEVVAPYMMGAGLAGGDWDIVSEMVEFYLGEVTICQL